MVHKTTTGIQQVLRIAVVPILLVITLVLAACGGGEEPTPAPVQPTATAAAPATQAAPATEAVQAPAATNVAATSAATDQAAVVAPVSPLSAPTSPLPTPGTTPKPTATTGALQGRILLTRPEGEIAVADMVVGLAEVIRDEQGVARVSGYEPAGKNRTTTDAYGRFILNDIKPGTYTLILDAVVLQYQLANETTGETIMVEIKPNETTDIGTLKYASLPLPGFGK